MSLFITDQTTHQTWSKTLTMTSATPDTSTAEWVAEAPSECANGATSECTPLPLADFGTATFTDAHTTSAGHTGSISDSNWTAEAVELEPSSSSLFGGGPGGFSGRVRQLLELQQLREQRERSSPDRLSDGGTGFSVKYGASLQTQSGSAGSDPRRPTATATRDGSGYGDYGYGGYGGYGYGSFGYGYGGYGYYGGWGY